MVQTEQRKVWEGEFGEEYTERNDYDPEKLDELYSSQFGKTRSEMNQEFLSAMDRGLRILEIGCNRGNQLKLLKNMGFTNLWGVEISKYALGLAQKEVNGANIIQATALDIPFKDKYFDMVFTSGVLIHISPKDLPQAIDEITRVSRKYIWGFEYFSEKCEEIRYRDHKNLLWKNDFRKMFQTRHPNLALVKEEKFRYLENDNIDTMYLLEKKLEAAVSR